MKKYLFIPLFLYTLTVSISAQENPDSLTILQNQVDKYKQEITDSLANTNARLIEYTNKIINLQNNFLELSQSFQNHESLINRLEEARDELTLLINQRDETINTLTLSNSRQKRTIDSLRGQILIIDQNIRAIGDSLGLVGDDLGTKIQETQTTANDGLAKLDKNLSQNKLYWITVSLVLLFLGGVIYWLLNKRISLSKTDVESQIKNTKKSLEEESVKLDSKLMELLETKLKVSQEVQASNANNDEIDHSLALKVADEIVRIQKNLGQMAADTRGLKQLLASVKRIRDNFASNGYELVDMLGKEYNDGMKATPNFIPSEDIEAGKQIITRIIKPQVNYKNEMIQAAQIEVSVGE